MGAPEDGEASNRFFGIFGFANSLNPLVAGRIFDDSFVLIKDSDGLIDSISSHWWLHGWFHQCTMSSLAYMDVYSHEISRVAIQSIHLYPDVFHMYS